MDRRIDAVVEGLEQGAFEFSFCMQAVKLLPFIPSLEKQGS